MIMSVQMLKGLQNAINALNELGPGGPENLHWMSATASLPHTHGLNEMARFAFCVQECMMIPVRQSLIATHVSQHIAQGAQNGPMPFLVS